jgi:diguanylate cyclase (GGDEF)-like protein
MLEPVLDVLRNKFGLTVTLIKVNWRDAFIKVATGEADFYGPIALSETRRQRYITVDPFYRSYSKIMTRASDPIRSMLGLYSRSVGLLEGSVISRTMRAYLGPHGKIIYFPTMDAMIEGLEIGLVDAFATVDNAEFEIFEHKDIQFEFSIENYYVDQGLISGNDEMRMLASLLNRYLEDNQQISDQIVDLRNQALRLFSRERFADEITYVRKNYDEITIYSDSALYPISYMENETMKGMLLEINALFEELTGVSIRFVTDKDYSDGISAAIEKIKTGECMAIIGAYYDIDTYNGPDIQYSPPLWLETIRTYSYNETRESLSGKALGAILLSNDYLGWNNTTGNTPVLYNSHRGLLNALKKGEVDAAFMGDMIFNYASTTLKDYSLREILGISAETTVHMLYGAQNSEINALLNQALILYEIINPKAMGQWKSLNNKNRAGYIRLRHAQQIWMTIALIVFLVMLAALIYLFLKVRQSLAVTKSYNVELIDKVHHDSLTGIYNRRFVDENLKRVMRSLSRFGGTLTLLMIDVDFFKRYNDTYGHIKGDECLKAVAGALAKSIKRADDFVARYGGEEFIVVLPNADEDAAKLIADRVLKNILELGIAHEKNDAANCVTISVGATSGNVAPTQKANDYIKRADEALYMSKQNGRNQYNFLEVSFMGRDYLIQKSFQLIKNLLTPSNDKTIP